MCSISRVEGLSQTYYLREMNSWSKFSDNGPGSYEWWMGAYPTLIFPDRSLAADRPQIFSGRASADIQIRCGNAPLRV